MRKLFYLFSLMGFLFTACQEVQVYEGIDGDDGLSVSHYSSLVDPTAGYVNGGVLNVFYYDVDEVDGLSEGDEIINSYVVYNGNDGSPGENAEVAVEVNDLLDGCKEITIIGSQNSETFIVCNGLNGQDGKDGVDGVCDCLNCDECYDCVDAGFFASTTNFTHQYDKSAALSDGWTIYGFSTRHNEYFQGLWGATDAVFGGDPNGSRNSMIQSPELQACELEQVKIWAKTVDRHSAMDNYNNHNAQWKYRLVITHCDGSETIVEQPTGSSNNWTNGTGPKPIEPELTQIRWKGSWFNVSTVRIETERIDPQGTNVPGVAKIQVRYHSTVNPNN